MGNLVRRGMSGSLQLFGLIANAVSLDVALFILHLSFGGCCHSHSHSGDVCWE